MNIEDIINKGTFHPDNSHPEYSAFSIPLFLKFFNVEIEVRFDNIPGMESDPHVNILAKIVNELIDFDESNRLWLEEEVWKHYLLCVETTSYGMVDDSGFDDEKEANMAHFNIYTPADALKAIELDEVMSDISFTEYSYFNLIFSCPWENEHGIWIGVKNRQFDSIQ
ncbi:MAG: hypothetical protein AAFQ94_04030 [Bacteroidota bacterium]